MKNRNAIPGVTRADRISDQGLQRLYRQLALGNKISAVVLAQWIKRYGEPAREIISEHGCYSAELDSILSNES